MGNFRRFLGSRSKHSNRGSQSSIWVDLLHDQGSTKEDLSTTQQTQSTFYLPQGVTQSTATTNVAPPPLPPPPPSPAELEPEPERAELVAEVPGSNHIVAQQWDYSTWRSQKQAQIDEPQEKEGNASQSKSSKNASVDLDSDLLIFSDTADAIPLFGRQFGIAPTSIIREQKNNEPEPEPELEPKTTPTKAKGFQDLFQQADTELDAMYMDYLKLSGKNKSEAEPTKSIKKKLFAKSTQQKPGADACIICLEPFSGGIKAPDSISIACQHKPSVCYVCLSKSIKNDLETKFWDEIKCPECKTLLIHDDIKRFADEQTFARYDRLSFRHAVSADKNFIWCLSCEFGQLHEKGAAQPMIRCLNCSAISCFKHSIKWHDEFTCDEYDSVLWDPDSYKAAKAKGSGSTEAKIEYMSKDSMSRAKRLEQSRQKRLHEAQKKAARTNQKQEAAAKEREAAAAKSSKDDFKEKLEMLKRHKQEEELSASTVEKTTKRCPGCQWPIEKNEGCDHMTCIKCHAEFCWICMNDYTKIREQGNSMHRRSCKFHTDNLR